MKTSFKKSLSVFMAVLMLLSVVSVSAAAATTYKISYKPGNYAKETDEYAVEGIEKNETVTLRGVTYTRTGYTHDGWSTNARGTTRTYTLERELKVTRNLTLYPYWVANKYDVTFAPGEFGTGTEVVRSNITFGKTTTAPDAIFTREGYLQIGWTAQVIEYTEDENGNEVTNEVTSNIELGGRTAEITSNVTYYPVWQKVVYDADIQVTGESFGANCVDYSSVVTNKITVTNNGNTTIKYTLPATAYYNVTIESGSLSLEPDATLVIAIQPKLGLGAGTYDEEFVFACDYALFNVEFAATYRVSEHSFDKYISDNNATYTADGTKTAQCSNGCGCTDTIPDVGSMKVFDAENNAAQGLLPEYIHHKTVRFVAYGSGMDNAEAQEGDKRFLPTFWYVNDTFNGEFTEASGFVVNYVHTDFGKFTLTINYKEQQLTNGEWVDTGIEDVKEFNYSIGPSEKDEQEIVRPNTIVNIIFGLFGYFFELLSGLFS